MAKSQKRKREEERKAQLERQSKTLKQKREDEIFSEEDLIVIRQHNDIDLFVKFNTYHSLKHKAGSLVASALLSLFGAIYFLVAKDYLFSIIFFALVPIFPLLLMLMQKFSVKSKLKNDPEFSGTTHTYIFREDKMIARAKFGKKEAKYETTYGEFKKIEEKKDVFYFYITDKNAFVSSKTSFVKGTAKDLREFLKKRTNYEISKNVN